MGDSFENLSNLIVAQVFNLLTPQEQIEFIEEENREFSSLLVRNKKAYEERRKRNRVNDVCYAVIEVGVLLLVLGLPIYGLFM